LGRAASTADAIAGGTLTNVYYDLDSCPEFPEGSVITIGNFDGVHRGHRAIIEHVIREATSEGRSSVIVTFDKHPAEFLRPDRAPCRLCTPERKIEFLSQLGADYLLVLEFNQELADLEPKAFVEEILVGKLNVKKVVVGRNFRFGRNRKGSLALLVEIGQEKGFQAREEELVSLQGFDISSTRVRSAIAHGDVEWAALALGRDHSITGQVQQGDRRGQSLGYPTMNVEPPERICLPGYGVYVGWAVIRSKRYPAAINVGRRPTFNTDGRVLVEAHLIDFEGGDTYGEEIEIGFSKWLRGEYRFADVDELVEQIGRDVEEVRKAVADGQ
jgi:riboflavin kinase/FMN adenylyltransferase